MAGPLAGNLHARCVASRSAGAICERSQHASPIAILIATPIIVKAQFWPSKIMRVRHTRVSPYRGTKRWCTGQLRERCGVLKLPWTFDAVSFVVDWQFAKKFDAYAGLMFSQVNGGLANGFLHPNTIDPTVGLRFRF